MRQERFGPSLKHGARDSRQAARSDLETGPEAKADAPKHSRDLAPPHSITSSAGASGAGGAVMFGDNASERRGRTGSYSAVHNGPLAMDVVFELGNHELLITDYAFDKIAD